MPCRTAISVIIGLLTAFVPAAASAQYLAGRASVVDADTLEIHGQRVSLAGIDAVEAGQLCQTLQAKNWRCGQSAALALANHIGTATVTCVPTGIDRYDRVLAHCSTKSGDLGYWLVRSGWAQPYYDTDDRYGGAVREAREARSGIWSGRFERPGHWRRRHLCSYSVPWSPNSC